MEDKYRVEIPDLEYYRKLIKCQSACPAGTNASGYLQAAARGDYEEGWRIAKDPNPLAAVCGWVCSAPCEEACRRASLDDPVTIRAIKRFLFEHGSSARSEQSVYPLGEKIAIVGSGPAGLTAAHDLARKNYRVTIFEALPEAGGMLRVGIPKYRLPRQVIDGVVNEILSMGVELKCNVRIGSDLSIRDLREQGYKAILLATGAHLSRPLPIEGMELKGVLQGVNLLREIHLGGRPAIGGKVIVIGGGNVAFDVARSVIRLGNREVHVVCLESREEMFADDIEIEEGMEEGIVIHNRKGPNRVLGRDGHVIGLEVKEVTRVFDEEGRFNPAYNEEAKTFMEADTIIVTIGQMTDLSYIAEEDGIKPTKRGLLAANESAVETNVAGIFTAGDVATGPTIIIDAVASGEKAARAIHEYLYGPEEEVLVGRMTRLHTKIEDLQQGHKAELHLPSVNKKYDRLCRKLPDALAVEQRRASREIVECSYAVSDAREQAERCLKCSINTVFDGELCILCGGCVDVCPKSCLKLVSLHKLQGGPDLEKLIEEKIGMDSVAYSSHGKTITFVGSATAMIKDEDRCIRCGLCERRCPVGAISMELFELEKVQK